MLCRVITIIFILSFGLFAAAKECLLDAALKDPMIANNADFWEDYSKLKNTQDDKEVGELLKKYGHNSNGSSSTASGSSGGASSSISSSGPKSYRVDLAKKAEKEIENLPEGLQKKVDEFMKTVQKPGGIKEIRDNPGRWRLEKLGGGDVNTVRLNDGIRLMFEMEGDELRILRVNAEQIHKNPLQH